jgi:hypothetical protein
MAERARRFPPRFDRRGGQSRAFLHRRDFVVDIAGSFGYKHVFVDRPPDRLTGDRGAARPVAVMSAEREPLGYETLLRTKSTI